MIRNFCEAHKQLRLWIGVAAIVLTVLSAYWLLRSTSAAPQDNCATLPNEIKGLESERTSLQKDLQKAAGAEKTGLLNQIKRINSEIQEKQSQLDKCPKSCPGMRECTAEEKNTPPQVHVEFPGPNNMTLHGHLYVPGVSKLSELSGVTKKYPLMIYNHGSEPDPKGVPYLAKLYLDHGYSFFAPDRHGQGLSKDAGPYIVDLQHAAHDPAASVQLHELYNKDVIAAVNWIKAQPYVDKEHIGMTGISYGGIQTLLTAEKDPGIDAYVPFAPSAESWGNTLLQDRLKTAVKNERAPMFIIQAEGDYNLGPVNTLGAILLGKGNLERWKPKLYPKFGCTNQDAHARFSMHCDGIVIWDQDVVAFLDKWVR
jgi:dienelactone hydrolase